MTTASSGCLGLPGLDAPGAGADCPGHWHATFAVFYMGHAGESSSHERLDWALAKTPGGRAYYDFGSAPKMSVAVHMHQSGHEEGGEGLGPAQFHFERAGCTGLADAFAAIDLDLSAAGFAVMPGSPLAATNPDAPTSPAPDAHLLVESRLADGTWRWSEQGPADGLGRQPRDGERLLLYHGDVDAASVQAMQAAVPIPTNRAAP